MASGFIDVGEAVIMLLHISGMEKPLGSAFRMNQVGSKVALGGGEGYRIHEKSGDITPIG